VEYAEENALRLWKKPPRRKIQPIAFSGRRGRIKAPTAEKEIPQITGTVAYPEPIVPPLSSTSNAAEIDKARAAPPTIQASHVVTRVLIRRLLGP
jgi:hypothetical protein